MLEVDGSRGAAVIVGGRNICGVGRSIPGISKGVVTGRRRGGDAGGGEGEDIDPWGSGLPSLMSVSNGRNRLPRLFRRHFALLLENHT